MHILNEEFRKELIDIYKGNTTTIFTKPKDIFDKVFMYIADNYDISENVDEIRELIDALADWTHNPTESGLRKILDVEETVSGYGLTPNTDEAIAIISYCITHGIPCDIDAKREFYKISFKDITISQRDAIIKICNDINFISLHLYPKETEIIN